MASKRKVKTKRSLAGKKFFTIVVLSVMAFGLIITTFAVQQPTNTESEASYASRCIRKPAISHIGSTNRADSVTYKIRVKNTAPRECTMQRDYWLTATLPGKYWTKKFVNKNGNEVRKAHNLAGQASKVYSLTVKPNSGARKGYHSIYVGATDVLNTNYRSFITLSYYKD